MHDAGAVGGNERLRELHAERHDLPRWQRIDADVAQRRAVDVFHDQEVAPFVRVEVEDGRDVGMVQPREGLRAGSLVTDPPVGEHLDGNVPVEAQVAGEVDDTHAPGAKAAPDLVVAELLAGHFYWNGRGESSAVPAVRRGLHREENA